MDERAIADRDWRHPIVARTRRDQRADGIQRRDVHVVLVPNLVQVESRLEESAVVPVELRGYREAVDAADVGLVRERMTIVLRFAGRSASADRRAAARQRPVDVGDVEQLELDTTLRRAAETEQQVRGHRV